MNLISLFTVFYCTVIYIIYTIYKVKEKCMAKSTEGESTPHLKTKILYEHGP